MEGRMATLSVTAEQLPCIRAACRRDDAINIKKTITAFGTDGVIKYRSMAAIRGETTIPETCLSLSIASSLITDCNWDAHVETSYSKIPGELGVHGTGIGPKFGGQRADIAIYENGTPTAIIEVKIIDEGRKLNGVVKDWQKIALLQQCLASKGLPSLPGYVGVLVCDVERKEAGQTVEELSQVLGLDPSTLERGSKNTALSLGWEWLFVCAELTGS
jgi:hypothetical protein